MFYGSWSPPGGFQLANAVPTLSSLLPASASQGSAGFKLRVKGENFVPGATAYISSLARPTEFVHPGELEIALAQSDLSAAGILTVEVVNPGPGGGPAVNTLFFSVNGAGQNPVPSVDWLLPGGVDAGDPGLTLVIHGANFVNGATIQWNGQTRSATFINSGELRIDLASEEFLIPGPAVVGVTNPGPGGGESNSVVFEVSGPGKNPPPSVMSIQPWLTVARGAASSPLTLRVMGQDFILGAQAQWNGRNRPTQFISESELWVTLNSFDVAFGGSGAVTVLNPAPGAAPQTPLRSRFSLMPLTCL